MNQTGVWKCLFRLKINLNIGYKNCRILKGEYQSDTYSFHLKSVSCSVHSIFDVSRLPSSIPFPPVVILFSSLKHEWYICWIIELTKHNPIIEKQYEVSLFRLGMWYNLTLRVSLLIHLNPFYRCLIYHLL